MVQWHRIVRPSVLIILGVALGTAVTFAAQRATSPPASDIVATVNGEPILKAEVAADLLANQNAKLTSRRAEFKDTQPVIAASVGALVLNRLFAGGAKSVTVTRSELDQWLFRDRSNAVLFGVEYAIQDKVIRHAARARSVTVSPEEIQRRFTENIATTRNQYRLGNISDREVLDAVGVRELYYRRTIARAIMLEKLLVKDLEQRNGHPLASEDYADVSQILIRAIPATPADTDRAFEEALRKANDVAQQIKSGNLKFEEAAKAYSDDDTRAVGGSMGLVVRGTQPPEIINTALTLPAGAVSEPVRSPLGWRLIRLNRPGKESTGPERFQVLRSYIQQSSARFLNSLVDQATIVNRIGPARPGFNIPIPSRRQP